MIARARRPDDALANRLGRAAALLWLLSIGLIASTLVLYAGRSVSQQSTVYVQGPIGVAAIALTGILYGAAGAFLLRRRATDPIGWAMLGIGTGMAAILPLDLLVEASVHSFRNVPAVTLVTAWMLTSVHLPASGSAAVLVMLLFPTGHLDWPRARVCLRLALIGVGLLILGSAVRPGGLLWYPTLPNPLGTPMAIAPVAALMSVAGVGLFVAALVMAVWSLVWRQRMGDPRVRAPLAWVALGASAMAVAVTIFYVGRYTGSVAGETSERLAFIAAIGAAMLPLAIIRFSTVTEALGWGVPDVTFLFTDLTDSTAMYARIGDLRAFDVVRLHFDTLSAVAERHGGEIVKTIGDALMARFFDPDPAVRAALEMFERLEGLNRRNQTALVLKVGVHHGEAIAVSGRRGTDYFGQTVNIAARIGALAGPGELVVSDAVRSDVSVAPLLADLDMRPEDARLKGVSGTVLVHRVRLHPGVST